MAYATQASIDEKHQLSQTQKIGLIIRNLLAQGLTHEEIAEQFGITLDQVFALATSTP